MNQVLDLIKNLRSSRKLIIMVFDTVTNLLNEKFGQLCSRQLNPPVIVGQLGDQCAILLHAKDMIRFFSDAVIMFYAINFFTELKTMQWFVLFHNT